MKSLLIHSRSGPSTILVGERLANLKTRCPAQQLVIITDVNVYNLYRRAFPPAPVIIIGSGEKEKNLNTVRRVYAQLVALEADRDSFLIGIGGGVVCDITGFAAATYMRGLRFGFVATSLLCQVDAGIGGKNGVNLNGYKNMVGTFRHPEFVICDPHLLKTLPPEEIRCGLAEVVKHAAIAAPDLFTYLEMRHAQALALDTATIERLVYDSARIKAAIVNDDEMETGRRRKLNFGHTFGHGIEKTTAAAHGQAVSAGMILACRLAVKKGYLTPDDTARLAVLLEKLELPVRLEFDRSAVLDAIKKDKKKTGKQIHFILLRRIGEAVVEKVTLEELAAVLADENQNGLNLSPGLIATDMKADTPHKPSGKTDVNALREHIDDIDAQLLDLVNQRLLLAQHIGALKEQKNIPVIDRRRESRIFKHLLAHNPGPLGTYDLHRIFAALMSAARRVQASGSVFEPPGIYAIFGDPVAHSLSPIMHNSAFAHAGHSDIYLAFRVPDIAAAVGAVRALGIRGASITLPHKRSVMAHLDELDDMAARIGAVNTIVKRSEKLCGYNTDWQGAVKALAEKTTINGRPVAVIGAGGAARAVAFGVQKAGGLLTILNRNPQKGEKLAADLNANFIALEEVKKIPCEIIINATPVGMTPQEGATPIDCRLLQKEMVVMDAIYSPLKTRLLAAAEALGCTTVDGLAMLVYQGAAQFELWTGSAAPVDIMRRAVQEMLLPEGKTA